MRLLEPLFEQCGVDVVFTGHVHNYQRSKPLYFVPADPAPAERGVVRGTFKLDEKFDGKTHTVADGVIHVVSGGGGAQLYTMGRKESPEIPVADPDTDTTFTANYIADRHSFSLVTIDGDEFVLCQIDENGTEIDRMKLTKTDR
jgi:hypothetical protein